MLKIASGNPDKLILIKDSEVIKENLKFFYGDNFVCYGLPQHSKSQERKEIIDQLFEIAEPTRVVLVADSEMIKTLAKIKPADGVKIDTVLGPTFVVPNYTAMIYNPAQQPRLDYIMEKVSEYLSSGYVSPSSISVLVDPVYVTEQRISGVLEGLYEHDRLAVDIETTGLHHYNSTIISIAFSWDTHHGIAIHVDNNPDKLQELKEFFLRYKGKKIFHNATFDTMFLIRYCFMKHLEDWEGLLEGLHCLYNNLEDTKIIAYLALNTCGKCELGLKKLAYEFTGDYAQEDIDNANNIPLERLLPYNITDTCATLYVYDKYYPLMIKDEQEEIYKTLLLPALKVLTQTQLIGLRIEPNRLNDLNNKLDSKEELINIHLKENEQVKAYNQKLRELAVVEYNSSHKTRKKSIEDYEDKWLFNFSSNQQVGDFLYNFLGLKVINLTEKGNPAVDADTLEELQNDCLPKYKSILENLYELTKLRKIVTSFMNVFNSAPRVNGLDAVYGSLNLCGTKSGRLSSSSPNIQNLPATGSPYAKPVKDIFIAPKGYIFVGSDFSSLEDRISALTTKDPNKLAIYADGFDSHCYRSYFYFKEKMPDIHLTGDKEHDAKEINSIKKKYPELRQMSKSPTFALI